jgi:hypothetical protein
VQRGGGKSYVLQYRAGARRTAPIRKLTIGRHGFAVDAGDSAVRPNECSA